MKRCEEVVPLLGPLADQALPGDDRTWVEDHARGCASCTDRLLLVHAQGQALRETFQRRSAEADFTGFADRVLARVEQERAKAPPVSVWGSELWGAHKAALTAVGGLAVAACAALAVFFAPARGGDSALVADASYSQVEEVDFGTHDGAVLQLSHDTTVIWMSDDKGVQE